ncbi:hypothetical protein [Campylobacter portucalensis]|uniref:hypothetical protein n=1 Tax=Campylobacter portucalensis TaxID=2608384 RepID=UPI001E29E569|nr:hypothetical protein [Campylobacter portucalensis]
MASEVGIVPSEVLANSKEQQKAKHFNITLIHNILKKRKRDQTLASTSFKL